MKNIFLKAILFVYLFTSMAFSQQREVFNIVVDRYSKPIEKFKGFGVEWDSRGYNENGVTESDFREIGKRIKWMGIPIVRMMIQTKWCYGESAGFDWDTKDMQTLYRHLEFCQDNNVDVLLTDWGLEVDWLAVDGISKTDDPKYANVIATYLDYLINKKGFTCIKYFSLVNEPNFEVGNFERWRNSFENVYNAVIDKGLKEKIKLVAPGQSNNKQWFFDTVDEVRFAVDVYDTHLYAWKETTPFGSVHKDLSELWEYAKSIDVNIDRKEYFVTEAGMRDGQSAAISKKINNYFYGVFMMDYAIQALQAGATTVLAWMLDDNSHPEFEWGLWKDKKHNLEFRPWFFTWSLLTRLFPKSADVYKLHPRSIQLRALGAKLKNDGWSFCVVNVGNDSANISINAEGGKIHKFYKYFYDENNRKVDSGGYPEPESAFEINLEKGKEFVLPGNSVLFLTTEK
jgi:hypothetical protein